MLWKGAAMAAVAVACLAISTEADASDKLKCRNVEWIVGWGAGGGSDAFSRSLAAAASNELGVPVKVINMPGASSIVGMQEVLSRPADGCTLFSVTPDQLTNELTGLTDLSYKTLTPLLRAHIDVGMLHAKAGAQFKSWPDVVAWAKANPGKLLVGGTGAASFDEVAVKIVMDSAGVPYRYIPYEGSKEMHADLLGGRLHLVYEEVSVMSPMISANQVAPMIALAEKRLASYPNVATARELGLETPPAMWRGVAAKSGTPAEAVATIEAALVKAAATPGYREFEKSRQLDLYPGLLGAQDFAASLAREHALYQKVIAETKSQGATKKQ